MFGLEGNSLKHYRKFPKGMGLALAIFEGRFESGGPYGDGGYRLKFTVQKIEKLEATAKASAHHDPDWVPTVKGRQPGKIRRISLSCTNQSTQRTNSLWHHL